MTNTASRGLFDLADKIALVSGSSGQLGRAYVDVLLQHGARVVALDLKQGPAGPLEQAAGERLLRIEADIADKSGLEAANAEIIRYFDAPANVLINNAALDAPPGSTAQETGPFESYPESSWDRLMEVNLKGVFLSCQVFGGAMAQAGGGSIINIGSIYGILSPDQRIYEYRAASGTRFFKPVTYSVAKSGIMNLTRYLATYWAGQGVRVNTLVLGGVFNNQDEEFLKGYCNKVPMGRMAQSTDYNGAVVFLASDASSYMTGAELVIDGGFSAW